MVRVTINGKARVLAEDAASVAALVRSLGF
jgi:hypothetical protein